MQNLEVSNAGYRGIMPEKWSKGVIEMQKNMERRVLISDKRVADALQKMHESTGVPKATYIKQAIAEKLARMDVHSMTIAEIEEVESERNDPNTI